LRQYNIFKTNNKVKISKNISDVRHDFQLKDVKKKETDYQSDNVTDSPFQTIFIV